MCRSYTKHHYQLIVTTLAPITTTHTHTHARTKTHLIMTIMVQMMTADDDVNKVCVCVFLCVYRLVHFDTGIFNSVNTLILNRINQVNFAATHYASLTSIVE